MSKMIWGWSQTECTLQDIQACVGPGWSQLLSNLVDDLHSLGWDGVVYQVKEKFGTLRFYIGSAFDEVHERVIKAEQDSAFICEDCGAAGEVRNLAWLRTLCDNCLNKA